LDVLLQQLPEPFMVVGDYNAHSPLWGCSSTDVRGRIVEAILDQNNVCFLNDGSRLMFIQDSVHAVP
jgi:hypothetical protein